MSNKLNSNDIQLISLVENFINSNFCNNSYVYILDVGFGNGRFISNILTRLKIKFPKINFIIYGLEVCDSGFFHKASSEYANFEETIKFLSVNHTNTNWDERLKIFKSDQKWIFPQYKFDFIVSNQVLEHVFNMDLFFQNLYDYMHESSISIHLFPLKECIWEFHVNRPLAHRIFNFKILYFYLYLTYLFKLRNFNLTREYTLRKISFIQNQTSYSSLKDLKILCSKYFFTANFDYSINYYLIKIRSICNLPSNILFKFKNKLINKILLFFSSRVCSITLCISKKDSKKLYSLNSNC